MSPTASARSASLVRDERRRRVSVGGGVVRLADGAGAFVLDLGAGTGAVEPGR